MSTDQELTDIVVTALLEVAPEADPATLDPDAEFVEQLDIDSMDFLNVITAIYERTGIEIAERDYPQLSTLAGAVTYLHAHEAAESSLRGGSS